jgi:hypothetical protein
VLFANLPSLPLFSISTFHRSSVLTDQDHPILLSSAIRECKTRGGLDTVGVAFGDAIVKRVIEVCHWSVQSHNQLPTSIAYMPKLSLQFHHG